jgi:S1-C subfamily serine protease
VVMDLAADGPAALAGLEVGDVVTAIGGADVSASSLSDVRRSLKIVPIGRPLEIVYLRGTESIITHVVPRDLIPQ